MDLEYGVLPLAFYCGSTRVYLHVCGVQRLNRESITDKVTFEFIRLVWILSGNNNSFKYMYIETINLQDKKHYKLTQTGWFVTSDSQRVTVDQTPLILLGEVLWNVVTLGHQGTILSFSVIVDISASYTRKLPKKIHELVFLETFRKNDSKKILLETSQCKYIILLVYLFGF